MSDGTTEAHYPEAPVGGVALVRIPILAAPGQPRPGPARGPHGGPRSPRPTSPAGPDSPRPPCRTSWRELKAPRHGRGGPPRPRAAGARAQRLAQPGLGHRRRHRLRAPPSARRGRRLSRTASSPRNTSPSTSTPPPTRASRSPNACLGELLETGRRRSRRGHRGRPRGGPGPSTSRPVRSARPRSCPAGSARAPPRGHAAAARPARHGRQRRQPSAHWANSCGARAWGCTEMAYLKVLRRRRRRPRDRWPALPRPPAARRAR